MAEELKLIKIRDICPDNRTCPAVHRTNRDTLMIIGRPVTDFDALAQMDIGPDELAIEVPQSLLPEVS